MEAIRNLKKLGAKNREINTSVKEAMARIMENRRIKEEQDKKNREKRLNAKKNETLVSETTNMTTDTNS